MRFRQLLRSLLDFVSGTGHSLVRQSRPKRQLRFEQLEPRALLSVNVTDVSLVADTGIDGDQITNDPRLSISTSGMSDYGSAVISLDFDLDGNGQYGDPEDQQGSLSFSDGTNSYVYDPADDPGVSLPDGPIKVRVRVDEFGYGGSGGTAQEFDFVLDTTAPVANVALKNDTGLSPSDGLTKDATLAGTGAAGDIVDVDFDGDGTSDGTATIDSNGQWSLAPSNLADGQYTAAVTYQDAAGNSSSTASLTYTLDTAGPLVTGFDPATGAVLVASPVAAAVTFNEAVDPATLASGVTVENADGQRVGNDAVAVGTNGARVQFAAALPAGDYTTMVSGVRDLAGNLVRETPDNPVAASWAVASAEQPTISIDDVTVDEGDAGKVDAVFTVTLSKASTQEVRVEFQTEETGAGDERASSGVDFTHTSGTVTIAVGQTTAQITVKVKGDDDAEQHEKFAIRLSNAVGATIADGLAIGTIRDNDNHDRSVSEVKFVPRDDLDLSGVGDAEQYGQLSVGTNPRQVSIGRNHKVNFFGGDRFFPDAVVEATTVGRNIVRVRAIVTGKSARVGDEVLFRVYDVDDPEQDPLLDRNSLNRFDGERRGGDNRGILNGLHEPGASLDRDGSDGYQGRLRAVNDDGIGEWMEEGATVAAKIKAVRLVPGDGRVTLIAEVDLLTSFSPGDNFAVKAVFAEQEATLENVPLTEFLGRADGREGSAVSPQLAVWRYLHVERDRMVGDILVLGDRATGRITGGVRRIGLQDTPRFVIEVGTNREIRDREFDGGVISIAGQNYNVIKTSVEPNQHRIRLTIEPLALLPRTPQTGDEFIVFQDDVVATGANTIDLAASPDDPAVMDAMFQLMQPGTGESNRFARAYIEPEYQDFIERGDSLDLMAAANLSPTDQMVTDARTSASLETNHYWVAYVASAFEFVAAADNDPDHEKLPSGERLFPLGATAKLDEGREVPNADEASLVYVEVIRDRFKTPQRNRPTFEQALGMVTIHEIGHQLGVARGARPGERIVDEHRPGQNIMNANLENVPIEKFFFDVVDVDWLRDRVRSPDANQNATSPE